jgi:signal peptidase
MNVCTEAGDAQSVKCQLAAEALRSSGKLRLCVMGLSMLPAIWPEDTVLVERISQHEVSLGDVVLVGREGKLQAHRVISLADDRGNKRCITRGDALLAPDPPLRENELLGRVSYVIRAGRLVPMRTELSGVERMTAKIVQRSVPATRALIFLHHLIHRREKLVPEDVVPCRS